MFTTRYCLPSNRYCTNFFSLGLIIPSICYLLLPSTQCICHSSNTKNKIHSLKLFEPSRCCKFIWQTHSSGGLQFIALTQSQGSFSCISWGWRLVIGLLLSPFSQKYDSIAENFLLPFHLG